MADSDVIITDGSVDWSGGIDSQAVTTLQSQRNPNGIQRNMLCWLDNATVRDGGINCRAGFNKVLTIRDRTGYFQGKYMYYPPGANPYEVYSISGHILTVNPDTHQIVDLTANFANSPKLNPDGDLEPTFVQAEQFLVIQCGDYNPVTRTGTLPFIWDGTTLRRSVGMIGVTGTTSTATYALQIAFSWVVPPVGNTVVVTLTPPLPAGLVVGNIGIWTNNNAGGTPLGTFEVMAVASPDITLKTLSSSFVGTTSYPGFGGATFVVGTTVTQLNEIPAARYMDYYMGRIWYSQGRNVLAGDIVGGPSGSAAYNLTDSVLKVTENPAVIGGDGFTIPSNDGNNIRGIKHSANIDASLGQGRLFVGTTKAIYALNVPVSRDSWIAATNGNQPLMTVVQLANGWVSDRSVTPVNGDLFFQSLEPGIRSLLQALRYFNQWGNIQISSNETRILNFNDRSLLRYSSGIYFDNRLLETSLPVRTDQGVVSHALIPLDFTPISSFNKERQPNWEGMYEGLDFFQVNTGDFGGRERAFATVRSQVDQSIQLWEIIPGTRFDYDQDGNKRITWVIEFPAFTWGDETELKRLVGAELWIDRLYGTVQFTMEYRPDGQACWIPWHIWKKCSTENSEETLSAPIGYPLRPCRESYFSTMTLPKPQNNICTATDRPSDIAYQFQPRLVIHGFCRVRGMYLHATKVGRKLYQNITC